jgi:hypothetical protein
MSMPYFVYKIFPPKRLEYMESFDQFPQAKQFARTSRMQKNPENDYTVKIIFANNPAEAERLLMEEREPRPVEE